MSELMASMPLTHERSIKDQFLARVNFIKSRTMLAARETYRLRNSSLGNYEIHKLKWSRLNSEKKKLLLRLVLYDYSLAFSSRYQTFTRKDSNFKAEKDLKSAKISIFFIEDWRVLIQNIKNIDTYPFNKKRMCMYGFHAPGSFSKNRSDV